MRTLIGWTGAAAALAGLTLAAGTPARAAGLTLLRPKDGDTVRETVKVVVPKGSIPPNGFASLFVDGMFRVAQAPIQGSSKPVTFYWDTKAKLPDNPVIQYHVGLASLQVGDKDGARKALTAALNSPVNFTGKDEARKALAELK